MISIDIPDFGMVNLEHLVLDYNGTLAVDGRLAPGVGEALTELADRLTVHVVTADTFGLAAEALAGLPVTLSVLPPGRQDVAKQEYVASLGLQQTVAMGNGRNDRRMLADAAVGVTVILEEGAAGVTLAAADVVCTGILDALALLSHPKRLVATLRS